MKINTSPGSGYKNHFAIAALAITMLLGYMDYLTGFELRIDIAYLLPVSLAVWYIGTRAGIAIALLSAGMIFFSDLFSRPIRDFHFIDVWNVCVILLFFIVVALALSRLRTALEEQRQTTLRLKDSLEDVKAANESLESFSYSVSHDLKSPLWHIEGFVEILSEKYSGNMEDEGIDCLERIRSNTRRARDLIEALLKLSRYSGGPLERTSVDMTAMVTAAIQEISGRWPSRALEQRIAEGVTARGDPALLHVIISNLVENALKYSQHNAVTRIEFGSNKEGPKEIYFIRDNGVGFSREHAQNVFVPFRRVHAGSGFEGSGIGLATVQRIVQRHGGRIWAESEVNKGATFFFTLVSS